MQHEDRTLLEDAFYADLYERHAPGLFAYVYQQTASREDAEDIVLDVFLTAHMEPLCAGAGRPEAVWKRTNGRLAAGTRYTVTSYVSNADVSTLETVPLPKDAPS